MLSLLIQDKEWDAGESEEIESSDDDDLGISDDDDGIYYSKKPKLKQRGRGGRNVKFARERKADNLSNRRRKGKASFEEDETSAEDSDSESGEEFSGVTRRGANLRKNIGRSAMSSNSLGRNNEVRTSTRSVRKVSYAESEESEEVDDDKKKKSQKVQFLLSFLIEEYFVMALEVLFFN